MRRAIAAVADLAFILAGTALLCVGASFISPAGPWLVSGAAALIFGTALAVNNYRSRQ